MSSHDHSPASSSHLTTLEEAITVAVSTIASPNTRRLRGRPRKRPRSSHSASSQSSPPRVRDDTPQDDVYAIKDIIDEKTVDGQRFYRIDWADDPRTGQVYEPTWEPEENANREAVDDWEWQKRRRVRLGTTISPDTERDQTPGLSHCSSPPVTICIDIQSKSDFLKARPEFDSETVQAITSSQLSDPSFPGDKIEVPATQFTGSSSQPSDDFVVPDSQSFFAEFSLYQQPLLDTKPRPHFSQTTIPDSQAFSTDLSEFSSVVQQTGVESLPKEAASQIARQNHSSGFSIPSHQPDINQVSIGDGSVEFDLENLLFSEQDLAALSGHLNLDLQPTAQNSSVEDSLQGFLTQPEYEFGGDSLNIAFGTQQHQDPQGPLPSQSQEFADFSVLDTPLDGSHQPAQQVSPYPESPSEFLTQPQTDLFSAYEGLDVVLNTSPRNSGQSSQPPQAPFEHSGAYNTCAAGVTLHQTDLALIAAFWALNRLAEMSEAIHQPETDHDTASLLNDNDTAVESNHTQNELQTLVATSSIINTVELDNFSNMDRMRPQIVEDRAARWDTSAEAVLFPNPTDIQQPNPASTIHSSLPSLETSTPASGMINPAADVDMAFGTTTLHGLEPIVQGSEMLATISPAALLASAGPVSLLEETHQGPTDLLAGQVSLTISDVASKVMVDADHAYGILPAEDSAPNEYMIALLPPTRARSEMFEAINACRQDIEAFETAFMDNVLLSTNHKSLAPINALLRTLTDMSNLPPYHKDFPGMSKEEWVRYARDTASKLSFLYEFLNSLRDVIVELVIVCAGGPVLEKVEAIVGQGGFTYRHALHQDWVQPSTEHGSTCRVVLVDTSQPTNQPTHLLANIVIAYDESADTSGLLEPYKTADSHNQAPIILNLVEVYSLEHVNRRLSPMMNPLERKYAQIKCMDELANYADDESAFERVPQPFEIAGELVHYLVQDGRYVAPEARWDTWEHQVVPEYVFNAYKDHREQLSSLQNHKRARDGSDEDGERPKRARIETPGDDVQLSEELKTHFGNNMRVKGGVAQVSLEKLEDLVGLVKDLQAGLDKKGEEVDSYIKTIRKFHPKYYDAIGDRSRFEIQRNQAIKEKEKVHKELERNEVKFAKVTEEKQHLERRLQELASFTAKPDVAAQAQHELALKQAKETAATAERQLASIRADLSFAQSRYQDASDKAAELGQENNKLKAQVTELETRANGNIVEIHRINAARGDAKLREMYEQERELRLDREREIDRKNDEMRQYKSRFGSRETRGSSVPRSPRVRQMGSRNTSPVDDGGGGRVSGGGGNGNGNGGSLLGPRSAHLRD
ncbi:hypothetical protein BD289DRAFT_478850 [Coniella lustricola]|uniref:Chromo domain-containing protein n=1 Tax=Coniella lustricola TaxID=2025994 RepID=A0A2T3ALG8_9PEZI|nr:hypothetical protein BD289DRAFT_478850 [Coniella lustricola]